MTSSGEISFADDAIEDVVCGRKSETLRLGEEFDVGAVLRFVRQNGEVIGRLEILGKEEVSFADLQLRDVRSHYSRSLEDLRSRLLSFYPSLMEETILIRYRFRFRS